MRNIIKNNYKLIILYLFTLIILFGFNFVFINYDLINNREYLGTYSLTNYSEKIKDDSKIITIKNVDKYVDTLVFNYNSNKSFGVQYTLEYYNKYGKISKQTIDSVNSNDLKKSYETIRKNVRKIVIKVDKNIKINNLKIVNKYQINLYSFLFISLLVLNIYLFAFKKEYFSKKIEKGFLVIALSVGLLFIICEPPFLLTTWDDQIHFKNVYEFGSISNKYSVFADKYANLKINFKMFNTNEERINEIKYLNKINNKTTNTSITSKYPSFNKLNYIPISILFKICNYLHIPLIFTFLLGKILFLLIYTMIIYFAIKIIPHHKYLLCLIGLLPTSLFIASNYSYDTFINASILLFISIFIYEMNKKKEKLNLKYLIISLLAIIFASFTKAIYAPLILMLLLYPNTKFENVKKYKIFKLGIILITILLCATFVLPTVTNPSEISDTRGGDTSEKRQIKSIINSPMSFTRSFSKNYFSNFLIKLIGPETLSNYAYLEKNGNGIENNYLVLLILLFFFTFTEGTINKIFNNKQKVYIGIILLIIMAFIWGALYLAFTPVGNEIILGVQGRYFIPLIFPLLLLFDSNKIKNTFNKNKYSSILYFGSMFVLYSTIFTKILYIYCL